MGLAAAVDTLGAGKGLAPLLKQQGLLGELRPSPSFWEKSHRRSLGPGLDGPALSRPGDIQEVHAGSLHARLPGTQKDVPSKGASSPTPCAHGQETLLLSGADPAAASLCPPAAPDHGGVGSGGSHCPGTDQPLSHAQWVRSSAVCGGQGCPAPGGAAPEPDRSNPGRPSPAPPADLRGASPARQPDIPSRVTCELEWDHLRLPDKLRGRPRPPSRPQRAPAARPRMQMPCPTANGRPRWARPAAPQPVDARGARGVPPTAAQPGAGEAGAFLSARRPGEGRTCRAGPAGAGAGASPGRRPRWPGPRGSRVRHAV